MTSSIEDIVRIKNKVMRGYKDKHPCLLKVLLKFFGNRGYGYQLLDERGSVLEEYTLTLTNDGARVYARPGIEKVCFTAGIKKPFLEELMKEVTASEDHFVESPLLSAMKYLPRYAYHLLHGDIKLGRTKN